MNYILYWALTRPQLCTTRESYQLLYTPLNPIVNHCSWGYNSQNFIFSKPLDAAWFQGPHSWMVNSQITLNHGCSNLL